MEIKAIACTLPNPDYFLVFHSHTSARKAVWTREDRHRFFQLRHILERLHSDPREVKSLSREQREALMPEGVSLDDALQSLTPCIVDANRATKNASYLHRERDRAEIAGLAGLEGVNGIRFVVLVKKTTGLRPKEWLLDHITRLGKLKVVGVSETGLPHVVRQKDEEAVDLDSLEFRSSPLMVSLARRYHHTECLLEGYLKVVCMPLDIDVRLAANKGGEVVKQVGEEWS